MFAQKNNPAKEILMSNIPLKPLLHTDEKHSIIREYIHQKEFNRLL